MNKQNGVDRKVREIRRKTRKRYSAEEKIRIVLEGIRGEERIASLCRREGIATKPVLQLEQGVPGSRETASDGRHQAASHQRVHESLDNLTPADVYHGELSCTKTHQTPF